MRKFSQIPHSLASQTPFGKILKHRPSQVRNLRINVKALTWEKIPGLMPRISQTPIWENSRTQTLSSTQPAHKVEWQRPQVRSLRINGSTWTWNAHPPRNHRASSAHPPRILRATTAHSKLGIFFRQPQYIYIYIYGERERERGR